MSQKLSTLSLQPRLQAVEQPLSPMPTEKALGKRKMTSEQLNEYFAKHKKPEQRDDSDDEQTCNPQGLAGHYTFRPRHGGLNIERLERLERPDGPVEPVEPVEVHPDDEHARDLLEALNHPISAIPAISDVIPLDVCENIFFSEDLDIPEL